MTAPHTGDTAQDDTTPDYQQLSLGIPAQDLANQSDTVLQANTTSWTGISVSHRAVLSAIADPAFVVALPRLDEQCLTYMASTDDGDLQKSADVILDAFVMCLVSKENAELVEEEHLLIDEALELVRELV